MLLKNAERFPNATDNVSRVEQLIPAYNRTRFPVVLSPAEEATVLANGNLNRSSWPTRTNRTASARRLAEPTTAADREQRLQALLHRVQRAVKTSDTSAVAAATHSVQRHLRGSESNSAGPATAFSSSFMRRMFGSYKRVGASNAWVVSGNKSATGKPVLANDPHMTLSSPSFWVAMHLQSNVSNCIGSSFPGLPAVCHVCLFHRPCCQAC